MAKKKNYSSIPRNGLEYYYKADWWALDDSWNARTATATNMTYSTSIIGYQKQVGSYNWSSSRIVSWTQFSPSSSTDFSISTWINYNNTTRWTIYGKYESTWVAGSLSIIWEINQTTNKITAWLWTFWTNYQNNSNLTLSSWKWYHIVMTYVASTKTVNLYINWQLDRSDTYAFWTLTASTYDWTLWVRQRTPTKTLDVYYNGFQWDTLIYSRTLSQDEIQNFYLEGLRQLWAASDNILASATAYFDFAGDSNDIIGWNNGTVTWSTLTTDRFWIANRAYSFDWVNDYINAPTITTWTSATFSFWLYKTNDNDQCYFIEEAYSNNAMCFFDNAAKKINYRFWATNTLSSTANPVTNSTWNYITITHTGTTWTIYINWVQNATWTVSSKTWSWTSFTLWRLTSTLYYFNWSMSDFVVFNTAKTADEVKELFRLSSIKYLYPFRKQLPLNLRDGLQMWLAWDVSWTTEYDASWNGNNGTLVNTPTLSRIGQHKQLTLNWTNQYANTIYSLRWVNTFTLSCWINTIDIANFRWIYWVAYNWTSVEAWVFRITTAWKIQFSDQVSTTTDSNITLVANKYYHIALVRKTSNTFELYVNWTLDKAFTQTINTGTLASHWTSATLWVSSVWYWQYWSWKIVNPMIYTKVLTQNEIQSIFYSQFPA